jgi:hypothetical protein
MLRLNPSLIDPVLHKASTRPTLSYTAHMKLCEIFLNVCVSLRILLTIPATVASAEKSFSKLKLIKNCLSTMSETRLDEFVLIN